MQVHCRDIFLGLEWPCWLATLLLQQPWLLLSYTGDSRCWCWCWCWCGRLRLAVTTVSGHNKRSALPARDLQTPRTRLHQAMSGLEMSICPQRRQDWVWLQWQHGQTPGSPPDIYLGSLSNQVPALSKTCVQSGPAFSVSAWYSVVSICQNIDDGPDFIIYNWTMCSAVRAIRDLAEQSTILKRLDWKCGEGWEIPGTIDKFSRDLVSCVVWPGLA